MQRQKMYHSHDGDGLQVNGDASSFCQSLPLHMIHTTAIKPGHLFGMHLLPNLAQLSFALQQPSRSAEQACCVARACCMRQDSEAMNHRGNTCLHSISVHLARPHAP